jgi:hypothetical protein
LLTAQFMATVDWPPCQLWFHLYRCREYIVCSITSFQTAIYCFLYTSLSWVKGNVLFCLLSWFLEVASSFSKHPALPFSFYYYNNNNEASLFLLQFDHFCIVQVAWRLIKADRDESSPYAAMIAAQGVAQRCKYFTMENYISCW